MKKLLLTAAALLALSAAPAAAQVVEQLGPNPQSGGTGNFSSGDLPTGAFNYIYEFELIGPAPAHVVIGGAINTYANDSQFISGFTGSVYSQGADNAPGGMGLNADTLVIGPSPGGPCMVGGCQQFSGSANLMPGSYHFTISGSAGENAGYSGVISTFAVPGPTIGAGLPGLLAMLGMFGAGGFFWRRRQHAA